MPEIKKSFDGVLTRRTKLYRGVITKSLDITDDDWALMTARGMMPRPEDFTRDDFVTFESWLANNFVDKEGDRFTLRVLRSASQSSITTTRKNSATANSSNRGSKGHRFKRHLKWSATGRSPAWRIT